MEGMPGFSQIPEKAELEFSITPPPLTCFCFLFFCFLIHVAFLCVCVSLISSACTNLQNYQKKKKSMVSILPDHTDSPYKSMGKESNSEQ